MEDLQKLKEKLLDAVSIIGSNESLEGFRAVVLGKDGILSQRLKELGSLEPEERTIIGQGLNYIKTEFEEALAQRKKELAIPLTKEQDSVLKAALAYAEADALWSPHAQAQRNDSDFEVARKLRASLENAQSSLLFAAQRLYNAQKT